MRMQLLFALLTGMCLATFQHVVADDFVFVDFEELPLPGPSTYFNGAPNPGVNDFISGGARFDEGPGWLSRALAWLYLGGYYAVLTPTLGHVPLFGSNFAMRRSASVAGSKYSSASSHCDSSWMSCREKSVVP